MRRQQLELITIRAVEHVLGGQTNEDSLIEFKATWPETGKVRQLAGHANSARGEDIIWIIGVDEKKHSLTNPQRQDSAQWWAQMGKRFDGLVAPEMTDLVVPIGESGAVTALLFRTDRSPYVISVPSGGAVEREVPIRDGTRTRSATRHELLRLLAPTASLPDFSVLGASLTATQTTARDKEKWTAYASAKLYVEQGIDSSSFFPSHGMHGTLKTLNENATDHVFTKQLVSQAGYKPGDSGIHWRTDGAIANGPTVFDVLAWNTADGIIPEKVLAAGGFKLDLAFQVAGSDRGIALSVNLSAPELEERGGSLRIKAHHTIQS
ncbi:hypothetical protein [Streptomyces griseorubiginosus]|uniref:hypothetical protein n=1 Tax=Streptomyces griseorubiginosus TaxID=67304 RepID=UPI0033206968